MTGKRWATFTGNLLCVSSEARLFAHLISEEGEQVKSTGQIKSTFIEYPPCARGCRAYKYSIGLVLGIQAVGKISYKHGKIK